jgi:asparagine synthase (glutamine-hydrolysing)
MCGIAGIIQPGPSSFDQPLLRRMMDSISHRGPDEEGSWQNATGEIAFVHRRLSIIDLSANACQPLRYRERYTVIHNGEIYNYRELKEQLQEMGHRFHSASDTEVIAAAYDHWKAECLQRFDGMFAFAVWDEEEKKLFIARDRFGEKPLFIHQDGHRIFFASEMKSLWAAGIEKKPNLRLLFNFITIGYTGNPEDRGETFYENIEKLPPAHYLICKPGAEPSLHRYWSLDPENVNRDISDEDAVERFRALLKTSVRRRLRSDVTVGSSLSGGLDSSSILSLMTREKYTGPGALSAFTAIFPGFEKDEAAYAATVAGNLGVTHHMIEIKEDDLRADWEKMMHFQEEPAGSASIYPQFCVFQLAKEKGVKVLLDGQGADEILAGYPKYFKWYWQELFRKGKLVKSGELAAAKKNGVSESFGIRNVIASLFPDMASVVLEKRYLLHALRHEDLDPEFIKMQSGEAYYASPSYSSLNGILHFNTCEYGLEELLRYADRNAMAHGREVRLPFLSHELVEFVFTLPAAMKIRDGRSKWILRESLKNDLPPSIAARNDKIGFEPPQEVWMRQPGVQAMIREAKQQLVSEGVLKKEVLNKPILARGAHETDNFDWRYLSAATIFK